MKIKKYVLVILFLLLSVKGYTQVYTTIGTLVGQPGVLSDVGYVNYNLLFYGYGTYSTIRVIQNDDEFKGTHIKTGIGIGFNNWSTNDMYLSIGINYNKYNTTTSCDCVDLARLWKVSFDMGVTAFMGRNKNIPVALMIDFRNVEVGLSIGYRFNSKKKHIF
jgi:hypothetical protein